MQPTSTHNCSGRRVESARIGFTLIELLTVVAIITLLIGILVPALSRARQQARAAASKAILKASGDGLEMFKNENPLECGSGESYPSSNAIDDPTEKNAQPLFGAQWLVRYLMGKNLDGYVPRRNVPRQWQLQVDADENNREFWKQKGWYDSSPDGPGENPFAPLGRVGPYLDPTGVEIKKPEDLDGSEPVAATVDEKTLEQPVMLDKFGYPVLYYAANTRVLSARRGVAPLACMMHRCIIKDSAEYCLDPGQTVGVYSHSDNGLFTGACGPFNGTVGCLYQPWDFAGVGTGAPGDSESAGPHGLKEFGTFTAELPDPTDLETKDDFANPQNAYTFCYYILNKDAFEATGGKSMVPYRRDSFILITPGADGVYGTGDDVTNF